MAFPLVNIMFLIPKRGRSILAFTAAISMLKHQKTTD